MAGIGEKYESTPIPVRTGLPYLNSECIACVTASAMNILNGKPTLLFHPAILPGSIGTFAINAPSHAQPKVAPTNTTKYTGWLGDSLRNGSWISAVNTHNT